MALVTKLLARNDQDRETQIDAASKLRVSTPHSMIDTDFEYGFQHEKWESLQLINNVPTFFSRTGDTPVPLSDVQTRTGIHDVYVTTLNPHGFIDGQPVLIQGLQTPLAEGYFTIYKILSPTTFAYRAATAQLSTGSIYLPQVSQLFPCQSYLAAGPSQHLSIHTDSNIPSQLNVRTAYPHGFAPNTPFQLTHSAGKRILNFDASAVAHSNFIIPGHHLLDTTLVRYSKNANGTALTGLTDNANYYVFATSASAFCLSATSNLTDPITITSPAGNNHQFITTEDATDGSFYTIAAVPSPSNFILQAPFQIHPNTFAINPIFQVDLYQSVIQLDHPHKIATGTQVVYSAGNGQPFGGLTSGATYYAIRHNTTTLKLAATADTVIPISFTQTTYGTGTAHSLTVHSIAGEVTDATATVALSNASPLVTGNNLFMYAPGQAFHAELPLPSPPPAYSITTPEESAFTISDNLPTPTPLRFNGTATTGLVSNAIYYARNLSTTTVSLHATPAEALDGTAPIAPAYVTGTLTPCVYPTVFSSTVDAVLSSQSLRLKDAAPATATAAALLMPTRLTPFANGHVQHRPVDGAVELVPPTCAHGQILRQTRRYFRHPSGKGVQCGLFINFNAPLEIDAATYDPNTNKVACTTKRPHRLSTAATTLLLLNNMDPTVTHPAWTGEVQATVTSPTTFEYVPSSPPSPNACPGLPIFWVKQWTSSCVRGGLYDDQNGVFFEYDGQAMYAVRRDSVTQLPGTARVTHGSSEVICTQRPPLTPGQSVVLRGMSYKVTHVADAAIYIQPPYRGTSSTAVTISLTIDTRTPQSLWNLDTCPNFNPRKIQMIYFDFSWYGASSLRYGIQDTEGNVRYVHKYIHANQHNAAFFRAAHLPARYEVCNLDVQPTWTPSLLHWGTSVIVDGGHQADKGYLHSAARKHLALTTATPMPLLSLRCAPSADGSIGGPLGAREIVHRAPVQPHALEILASHDLEITLLLNATVGSQASWAAAHSPSLCQQRAHDPEDAIEGGTVIFQCTVPANSLTKHSLQEILPLGNSIIGGDGVYPDGPDVLTVVAQSLYSTVATPYSLFARLVWEE